VIDINGVNQVHLSAPLRGLAPPEIAKPHLRYECSFFFVLVTLFLLICNYACSGVLHAGHLLIFATHRGDLQHGTTTRVSSGAPLACVHLHNAITSQKTPSVFEVYLAERVCPRLTRFARLDLSSLLDDSCCRQAICGQQRQAKELARTCQTRVCVRRASRRQCQRRYGNNSKSTIF
jgi:hypothetical protein